MTRRIILGTVTALATLAATGLAVVSANADTIDQSSEPINLAYYARWNVVGGPNDFYLKDVHESGAADDLTHLAYAFANVSPEGDCLPQLDWGDYTYAMSAGESVDGVADTAADPIVGQFHQLKKLKELHPDLNVTISLGGGAGIGDDGAGEAFAALAADPALRADFIENCVDVFLRGNLPVTRHGGGDTGTPRGGPGTGAGIFDGIDIDWEWPDADSREDFAALHTEFRAALDELSAETGEQYSLNTTVPGNVDSSGYQAGFAIPAIFEASDFVTIQGYNMYGAWSDQNLTTNHHAQLFDSDDNPYVWNRHSTAAGIEYMIAEGAPADKIVLGAPSFARGWTGVPDVDNGRYQTGTGPADGSDGSAENYSVVKNLPGTTFIDEETVAAYHFDGTTWWSYDVPETMAIKTQYTLDNGLGGMMVWDIVGDRENELISTIAEVQAGG